MLNKRPSAVIFGCSGLTLTDEEKALFQQVNPVGFIVFARNIDTPEQLKALCRSLRETVGRDDAPILIDQEGGRVCRMKPPHWPKYPPARVFGNLYEKEALDAFKTAYGAFRLIGRDLREVGLNVDCAPDLDIPAAGSNDAIMGDRTFSANPHTVGTLGATVCNGLMDEGVLPVIKHIPGHGRALVDSHFELPTVTADLETLKQTDFKPFKYLADAAWGMTAHVVYTAIDAEKPASLSEKVIHEIIRGEIGFKGFLICDDVSMKALSGTFAELTTAALAAGCDAVLHCNGKMEEMTQIAKVVPPLSDEALERFNRGQERLHTAAEQACSCDYQAARHDLEMAANA